MRDDLHEDPAVTKIARMMGGPGGPPKRPEEVIGYLLRFWSWASRNTRDGVIDGLTLVDIESLLAMPNFLHYLRDAGWLEFIESTNGCQVLVPNFDRHLSEGAKQRALRTERKRSERLKSRRTSVALLSQKKCDRSSLLLSTLTSSSLITEKAKTPKKFTPPTIQQVRAYCQERKNEIDPESFIDYFAQQGWILANGRKVKDWKACIRTWEKRDKKENFSTVGKDFDFDTRKWVDAKD